MELNNNMKVETLTILPIIKCYDRRNVLLLAQSWAHLYPMFTLIAHPFQDHTTLLYVLICISIMVCGIGNYFREGF